MKTVGFVHGALCSALFVLSACGGAREEFGPCLPTTQEHERAQAEQAQNQAAAQGSVREVDDGVVRLSGTPDVPAWLHQRMQQYLNTRSAFIEDVSADGRKLLITTRFGNAAQLHIVEGPMQDRRQLTFFDDAIAGAAFLPWDSSRVLLQHDTGGNENHQLYFFSLATGQAQRITDGTSRNPQFLVDAVAHRIFFTSTKRNGRDVDVWTSNDQGQTEIFLERTGDTQLLDLSKDGTQLLLLEYRSINDSRVDLVNTQSKQVRRLSPATPASDRSAIFGRNSREILLLSDRHGEFVEAYRLQLGAAADAAAPAFESWQALSRDISWNIEEIYSPGNGAQIGLVVNEGGISKVHSVAASNGRRTAVQGLPLGVTMDGRSHHGQAKMALTLSGPKTSGDVFVVDLVRARAERWTQSEMGGLDPNGFVEPQTISYPSFDGKQIPAFLYLRPGTAPSGTRTPVVIDIHGGPEAQARPWFSAIDQFLARDANVAVLVPNVRGSDGYGKSYVMADNGRNREDSVKDIGALLDWIATQDNLDASRVAVYGGSYGGYMVLASLSHFSDRLVGGIDVVGIANFVTFLENTAPYRRDLRRAEYGDESDAEMRSFLQEISPVNRVANIQRDLFVVHGGNDPRVPASEAEQIVSAVRASGHPVWYMLARNEGHGFVRKQNRDTFLELSVLFLSERLRVSLEPASR